MMNINENEQKELINIVERFKTYLPEFILKSPHLKEIFSSEIIESYYLNKYAKELLNELSISTVTEKSINKWEDFTGLRNENLSIEERVNSVVQKFSLKIHANYFNFLSMLRSFDSKTELEEFISEYRILIKTYSPMSYANLLNFMDIIHSYKPAHIGFNLEVYRDIYKNTNKALIFQNTKYTNINVKPYSDKAKTSTHTGLIVNKTREINTHIKVVSDKIQKPFFMGALVNKIKTREVNFNRESRFKSFSSNGIIINKVKIRRCSIE